VRLYIRESRPATRDPTLTPNMNCSYPPIV
jgi:hypothetical protein